MERVVANKASILEFCKVRGYRPSTICADLAEKRLGQLRNAYTAPKGGSYDAAFHVSVSVFPTWQAFKKAQRLSLKNDVRVSEPFAEEPAEDVLPVAFEFVRS